MPRLIWMTDLHLNHCRDDEVEKFFQTVHRQNPDALLISGDFCESPPLEVYLRQINRIFDCPVYFVLGNHDFYHSSITAIRIMVAKLCVALEGLNYLTCSFPLPLTDGVGIVGHDGWSDARLGDYENSTVMLQDYRLIDDLASLDKNQLREKLHQLGDEAANHIRTVLPRCFEEFDQAFLLTHVPPFRDACWYEGHTTDDNWAPHFTCKAMGEAILEVMEALPDKQLTVLTGHCHNEGSYQASSNVEVLTGAAEYGKLQVTKVFEL